MQNKSLFHTLGALAFLASVLVGFYLLPSPRQGGGTLSESAPVSQDQTWIDFSAQFSSAKAEQGGAFPDVSFYGPDGTAVRLTDVQAKPILLVNIWARWCAPCVRELPSLQQFMQHYSGKIQVVAIAYEEGQKPQDIATFLKNRGLSDFAAYVDTGGDLTRSLGLRGVPTSFIVGKNGQILYRLDGDADWMSDQTLSFFDSLLHTSL